VNLDALNTKFDAGAEVTPEALVERGLVHRPEHVKVLGNGALNKALNVRAHAFSASAKEKIAAAGGTALEINQ
jgi:large subunit ribosomal protein L15